MGTPRFYSKMALKIDLWRGDGGIGKASAELAAQPYGPWLLGAVALGLIAYAVYALVQARYRWILR